MSTLGLIEDILRLSGPFTSEKAREAHRHWLEGRSTERLLERQRDLLASARRPGGQRELEFCSEQNQQLERQDHESISR